MAISYQKDLQGANTNQLNSGMPTTIPLSPGGGKQVGVVGAPEFQHTLTPACLGTHQLPMGCLPLIDITLDGYSMMAIVDMGAQLSTVSPRVANASKLETMECSLPTLVGAQGVAIQPHWVV